MELLEPMIASLLKKQKEDKAIGLLGIILSAPRLHLPALERLAAIYKSKNHKSHLEVVYRVILEEARAGNLKEKMFVALSELADLRPRDEKIQREYRQLKKQIGFADEAVDETDALAAAHEEDIELLLAKVDLYINQGLVRNARRILETLNQRFPHSEKIAAKIAAVDKVKAEIKAEEIPVRVGRIQEIETKIEAAPELAKTFLSQSQDAGSEKRVTAADLFADTEILPLPAEEEAEKRSYDLTDKIVEELELLHGVFSQQLRGDISILEKELTEIVRDFRDQVNKKIDTRDYETRFHLGLAYLEQGLVDEAIEEFLLASEDSTRSLECYSIISKAYRQIGNFDEAAKWLEKSLGLVKASSPENLALEYELATLHEEKGDHAKALELYQKIRKRQPGYRDVGEKINRLG
jgi:tetratricopeptide (TPR) repeat protein